MAEDIFDGPAPIAGNWHGFPDSFAEGVDAAIQGRGDFEGMGWFFKGSEYIRFNDLINAVDIGPRPIAEGWHGWPDNITSVDCAVSGSGPNSRAIFFFRDDKCVTYDLTHDAGVQGPVTQIIEHFPLLAPFIKHPQLFLVETLTLGSYFGEITAGSPQGGTQSLGPHEEETYTVIVSHSETETILDTTTVLESQDQRLIDDVNTSMNDESAKSRASDQYDYKFDSSFTGDLSYTGLGGSVDATLNFAGSSNDVREAAATAARSAVQKQIGRTEENRRQSTRVEAGSDVHGTETESTFTKVIRNDTDEVINLGVFQLFQEYFGVVTLTEIKLAFSNGTGPPAIFPLPELDVLLAKVIADPTQGASIKAAITHELSGLLDYQDVATNVIADAGDGRIAFSHQLTSTLDITNTDGSLKRRIVVPGLLVEHYSFKQLTEAMIIEELTVGA